MTSLLRCEAIVKTFGGIVALWQAGFEVRQGEILGLIGPNGSGKTTMINVISGQYKPDSGQIIFDGQQVTHWPPHRLANAGLARTYQIPRPFMSMSVLDNVSTARMFGRHGESRAKAEAQAMEALAFVGLSHKARVMLSKLNLHERKFLEIARALALEPKLILLDEVLAGLNPTEIEQGMNLIRRIHAQGIGIVFVEHNVRAVSALSHRIVVLNYGQQIADGTPEEVMSDEAVIAAYLGTEYAAR